MANIQRIKKAPIPIELDRTRHLRYTLGSFAYLEEKFGTVEAAFSATEKGSIRAIIEVLYAGLSPEDKELTPEIVADLIDVQDINELAEAISKALNQDKPAAGKTQAPKVQASK